MSTHCGQSFEDRPVVFFLDLAIELQLGSGAMIVRVLSTLLISAVLSRPVFASGGEVLDTIFLQLTAVAACIIVPSFFAKGWIDRSIIAGMVLLGSVIELLLTLDMPYRPNKVIINILSVGAPVLGLVIAVFIISIRDKQRGTGRRT